MLYIQHVLFNAKSNIMKASNIEGAKTAIQRCASVPVNKDTHWSSVRFYVFNNTQTS
jgi:hypothetical protein